MIRALRSLRGNLLFEFSFIGVVVIGALAALIAAAIDVALDQVLALLEEHDAAVAAGAAVLDSDAHSIAGLTDRVQRLQWMVIGVLGGGFVFLYSSLVYIVWRGWETITSQRERIEKSNADLSDTVTALEQSEARFRTVFESAPNGIAIADEQGTVIQSNRALQGMVGYTSDELLGQPLKAITHPEDVAESVRQLDGLVAGRHEYYSSDGRFVRKDGSISWGRIVVSTLSPLGDGFRCIVMVEDITERKLAEERLREAARLASVGELAAGVAHEINNPLNTIMGFTQLLMKEGLPGSAQDDLGKIYTQTQRAARVVRNLLSFSRSHEPQRTMVSPASLVERALELKAHDFERGNLTVETDLPADLPSTMLDEHQLVEVVVNILINAEQAMAGAGGGGRLTIKGTRLPGTIRISIGDSGPGMAPEAMGKIFDPFFTTKEVGGGTGLGLSISHGTVQAHGGRLWAESAPGEGATLHIDLPIVDGGRGENRPGESSERQEGVSR